MSPQDDLFAAQDAAGQSPEEAAGSLRHQRSGDSSAPAAPVDRTTIAYYAALQSYYRFGAWPEGVPRC